jgi:hypothetical protein
MAVLIDAAVTVVAILEACGMGCQRPSGAGQ